MADANFDAGPTIRAVGGAWWKGSLLALILGTAITHAAIAQYPALNHVTYDPTDEIFANPERGFYSWTEGVPGGPALNANTLRANRNEARSLIIRLYYLADFREADLTQAFIDQLDADFSAIRDAGLKVIIRFRYSKNEAEPDAPLERVLSHLDQLAPVFERNYDVIAVAQAGFIGAWGEWHASSNNLTTPDNMRAVLFKYLDVLPERHVQVRYPEAKMQVFETHSPIGPDDGFSGSNVARTGHHNDCFLASRNDVGTYRISPTWEKNYISAETRYVPMGGETCRVREGEFYFCENAIHELEWLRWSYLNNSYYRGILDHWTEGGCMPDVQRRLGYRFVLDRGSYSESVAPGSAFRFEVDITNEGFASPFNRRGIQVILQNVLDPEIAYEVNLPSDPRLWLGGETLSLALDIGLPPGMEDGVYQTYLFLHDPAETLKSRPEYAIRLANSSVWQAETGYNDLGHTLVVDSDNGGAPHDGNLWFVPLGTSTSTSSNASTLPSMFELHQNYPNPFNPSTTIRYSLRKPGHVSLDLYNLVGQHVDRLFVGKQSAGSHKVAVDGSELPSGTYYYVLTAGGSSEVRSMVLLK